MYQSSVVRIVSFSSALLKYSSVSFSVQQDAKQKIDNKITSNFSICEKLLNKTWCR